MRQSVSGAPPAHMLISPLTSAQVRAYEILSDPTRRAEYILKNPHRPRGSGSGGVGAASPSWGGKGPSPVDVFNASMRQGRRRRAGLGDDRFAKWTRGKENTGSEDEELKGKQGAGLGVGGKAAGPWDAVSLLNPGLLGRLQDSFQEAMIHAYLGPYVADNTIPWAFEAEERRARGSRGRDETRRGREGHQALHPHILEMTSGQQLLGYVESAPVCLEALLEGMTVQEKRLASRPGADMASKGEGEGEGGADGLCLRSQLSGMVSLPDKKNFASLRVMWQGQCLGRGMRFWDSDKKEDVVLVEAYALRDNEAPRPGWFGPQAPEQTGDEDMMGSYVVRGLGARRLLSSHPVRHAASGAVSHVLVSHRTPLVSHFHLLQAEGGVECRVSKGDLKAYIPSEYWRFPPRSPDHDVGSWYIERTGLASPETERTLQAKLRGKMLPPVVMMLVCAFKTLDKEEQEVGKGGGPSRLQETLRGWVERVM